MLTSVDDTFRRHALVTVLCFRNYIQRNKFWALANILCFYKLFNNFNEIKNMSREADG